MIYLHDLARLSLLHFISIKYIYVLFLVCRTKLALWWFLLLFWLTFQLYSLFIFYSSECLSVLSDPSFIITSTYSFSYISLLLYNDGDIHSVINDDNNYNNDNNSRILLSFCCLCFIIDNYNNDKKNIGNINAKNKNNCIFYKCRNWIKVKRNVLKQR